MICMWVMMICCMWVGMMYVDNDDANGGPSVQQQWVVAGQVSHRVLLLVLQLPTNQQCVVAGCANQ